MIPLIITTLEQCIISGIRMKKPYNVTINYCFTIFSCVLILYQQVMPGVLNVCYAKLPILNAHFTGFNAGFNYVVSIYSALD